MTSSPDADAPAPADADAPEDVAAHERSIPGPPASEDPPAAPVRAAPPGGAARLYERFGRRFEAGEVIFREGEPGTEAYLLEEGRVRLIKKLRGIERSIMVLRPGDLFGESALVAGAVRSSTAIALSAGLALALDQTTLQRLLEHDPASASRMVQQLVRRLRDAEDQIEIMMLTDTQSKIVYALLKLAQQARDAPFPTGSASLAISPTELSTRIGLDVDAVKRGVQKLREGQYVRVSDERLEVPDLDALRRLYALLGLKAEIRGEPDGP